MGIKERQDRERQAVRQSILDAARDLFVAEGYRNVSIRKIAERIEYSPAAIYSYFPSKDDIFFALAEEGFRRLDNKVRAIAGPRRSAWKKSGRCWWAYYEFSKEQREFFELMFIDRSVPQITGQWTGLALVHEMLGHVAARLQRCIDTGRLPRNGTPRGRPPRHVGGADRPGRDRRRVSPRPDRGPRRPRARRPRHDARRPHLRPGTDVHTLPAARGCRPAPVSSGAPPHDA